MNVRATPISQSSTPNQDSARYLTALDKAMEKLQTQGGVVYLRYVDDILILGDTPRRFRKAIRLLNQHLASAGLLKHPDKTSIGKIENGFDFLGYHFEGKDGRVTIARDKQEQFIARLHRLYETSTSTPPAQAEGGGLSAVEREAHPWLNEEVLADHGEATVRAALRSEGQIERRARLVRSRPAPKARPHGQQDAPVGADGVAGWPGCVVEYVRRYLSWATGGLYPRIQRVVREELMKPLGSFSIAVGYSASSGT